MFNATDWIRLFMAVLIILPLATTIREMGYYLAATLLRSKKKKLIIGSGPVLFTIPTVEVRRYFFMYSWMEYEELTLNSRFWHGFIYASPIITTGVCAIVLNALVLEGVLEENIFWSTFIFYCFYYVFFDIVPVYLPDGQPTNGRAIYDLIRHGERSDFKKQDAERSYTASQEETMQNRDRDEQMQGDHTNPEQSDAHHAHRSHTETQEKTKINRDRDERKRSDHTN
ncbi:hypothetical protein [Geomicrobium sp. JCM 19039]|uniref:hypothetical protein n=1 Tax=Geomicrobium sp. JCM 19039 TaxID=1460636 RepID=UPI00045F1F53|nr:hypothetical protein [Geomicrobium sp. JCM 19039]GAK14047.1 hypothetical protein JCM19039_3941 [Geomicrobium sp. JCM 19039]